MHIPDSASPSLLTSDPLVISKWEDGISGLLSLGPETPNGLEGHRPARTSPEEGAGMGSDMGPPASLTHSTV